MSLAILTSHPIQYYAPLFRELARRMDVKVFFAHRPVANEQGSGFGTAFEWDVDLLSGYDHEFLRNSARRPDVQHFAGCDTPDIGAVLDARRFRSLLVTGWHLRSYIQGIAAARRRRIPVLVRGDSQLQTPRSAPRRMAKEVLYPRLLRVFSAALHVGSRNRAYFEHYRYPANRLFHSPHCIDTQRFAAAAEAGARQRLRGRLGIGEEERVVLFAGKLVPFKRPLDVVEAVHSLRRGGVPARVMIAGAGALEAETRQRAAAMDVPLDLLGFQNQTEMPAAYAASDVLALPSDGRETWGLVCNEALACGRPIVVSDQVGCAPDLAGDQSVGRVFAGGNVAALTEALAKTIASPPTAASIASLSARHSLEAAADGVVEALERVAA